MNLINFNDLPKELICEILRNLPTTTPIGDLDNIHLHRASCVCKLWNKYAEESTFLHLLRTYYSEFKWKAKVVNYKDLYIQVASDFENYRGSHIIHAAELGYEKRIDFLVRHRFAKVNDDVMLYHVTKNTPLLAALTHRNMPVVMELLKYPTLDLDDITPRILADLIVRSDNLELVKVFIDDSRLTIDKDFLNELITQICCYNGQIPIKKIIALWPTFLAIQQLVERKFGNCDRTPLLFLLCKGGTKDQNHYESDEDRKKKFIPKWSEMFYELVNNYDLDLTGRLDNHPLKPKLLDLLAESSAPSHFMEYLLKNKVSPNSVSRYKNWTHLHLCMDNNRFDFAKLLLSHPHFSLVYEDNSGDSLMFLAVSKWWVEIVALLAEKKAKIESSLKMIMVMLKHEKDENYILSHDEPRTNLFSILKIIMKNYIISKFVLEEIYRNVEEIILKFGEILQDGEQSILLVLEELLAAESATKRAKH